MKSYDVIARLLHKYHVVRDVVRHRTIIFRYPTWTRIAASFWTWPKTAKTSWDWPPMTATSYDVARSSHNLVERRVMSLIVYIVRWCCTTSCDLVRPSKISLRYPTMLGISTKFLNISNTPKTSGDNPWWLRRRATSHDYTRFTPDGPWSPIFTHRKSSYGVVKAGVTVALLI